MTEQEIYDGVFTDDMEYPVGMNDDEAQAVWHACEKRFLAGEMAYQVENGYPWAGNALAKVEAGETTWKGIFEEAWDFHRNEDRNYEHLFKRAVEEPA